MRRSLLAGTVVFVVVFNYGLIATAPSTQDMSETVVAMGDHGRVLGAREADQANIIVPEKETEIIRPARPEKISGVDDFDITASSGLVMDCSTGEVLVEKNSDDKVSIASITKLMTAMVFLDNNPGWENYYEIKDRDIRGGGRNYIYSGEAVTLTDLFNLALIASENTAAMSLARSTGLSDKKFVQEMNEKAKSLGLGNTEYAEPVGLDNGNVSTARDLAIIVNEALKKPEIAGATAKTRYPFTTKSGTRRTAEATNKLLTTFSEKEVKLLGGKTGHTDEAGYCFSGKFKNDQGKEVVSVILGGQSPDSRFSLTKKMVDWVYENFRWK